MKQKNILTNPLFIYGIVTLIVIVITAQSILTGPKTFGEGGVEYTRYNNYIIFKQSFFHLIDNKDLYQLFPNEHWDYYKYSPSFPLLMAPLAYMPDAIGLFFWNLFNVLILAIALWKLPFPSDNKRLLAIGFILIEAITSMQNSQSNGLIAGLIIFAFIFLEKKNIALASLLIVLTVFIKPFGLVALALFMFYPDKLKAIIYTIGWTLLLAFLPLIFISFSQLTFLYQSWLHLLQNDHSASIGYSVAGWLYTWFGIELKNLLVLLGVVLFCLPFLRYKFYNELKFKLFFLSSILIWIVIFNHKAESPTFIIAVAGVAVWFFYQEVKMVNLVLMILVFIFTVLAHTDIFPRTIRENFMMPYVIKAVPCILIWFKIMFDFIFYKKEIFAK